MLIDLKNAMRRVWMVVVVVVVVVGRG